MQLARLVCCLVLAGAVLAFAQGASPSDEALRVYEQGKALYDQKDFGGALERFDAAIALEPTKARWHYNRGLALRKLKRDAEAREALLRSRELEPDYKRKEIDEKLAQLGGGAAPPAEVETEGPPARNDTALVVLLFVGAFGIALSIVQYLRGRAGKAKSGAAASKPRKGTGAPAPKRPPDPLVVARLQQEAEALARVDHALSLGEDAESRAHADRATTNLAAVRRGLETGQSPAELIASLDRAKEASALALSTLESGYGPQVRQVVGPRAGCFFCARALPTAAAGAPVQVSVAAGPVTVAACPTCARRVASGQPPPVLMVQNGRHHWSEDDAFDPYLHAHAPPPGTVERPAWTVLQSSRPLGTLAAVAGGAVLGGLGAVALGRVLDLDGLRQADLASAAATASARAAATRRSTEYSDHS